MKYLKLKFTGFSITSTSKIYFTWCNSYDARNSFIILLQGKPVYVLGYYGDGFNAIIVFAGCYLPDRSRRDYQYVMDHLFLWVLFIKFKNCHLKFMTFPRSSFGFLSWVIEVKNSFLANSPNKCVHTHIFQFLV